MSQKTPDFSNNDLSNINEAIDSLKVMGDVGDMDLKSLDPILSHCTIDQLTHIENCSKGRDLTPITNKLWKNFYERKFGKVNTNSVIERMRQKKVSFKWKQLYEAKMSELELKGREIEERFIQNSLKEKARKQSRQVMVLDQIVVPNFSRNKKRNFQGSVRVTVETKKFQRIEGKVGVGESGNNKSKLLRKAKREAFMSLETINRVAYQRNVVQR